VRQLTHSEAQGAIDRFRDFARRRGICTTIEAGLKSDQAEQTDDALVERLLAGDESAFSEVATHLQSSLLRLARTFVADHGAAEEVVQETWLGVVKGLRSFERRSSLKTWIFRILVNRARTRGARDGRTMHFSALNPAGESGSAIEDRFSADGRWAPPPSLWTERNPEDVLLRAETADILQHAIDGLPPIQRAVLTLRDIDGLEAREVCNMLAITETNQRVLLHRARTRVRAALEVHLKRE
jgi:RNA polymerase sigma-70 factor (ECF subfamily)